MTKGKKKGQRGRKRRRKEKITSIFFLKRKINIKDKEHKNSIINVRRKLY